MLKFNRLGRSTMQMQNIADAKNLTSAPSVTNVKLSKNDTMTVFDMTCDTQHIGRTITDIGTTKKFEK